MWRGYGNGLNEDSGTDDNEVEKNHQLSFVATIQKNALYLNLQGTHQVQQQRIESLPEINNINYLSPLTLCEKSKEKWLENSTANLFTYEVVLSHLHFRIVLLSGKLKLKLVALAAGILIWKAPAMEEYLPQVESRVVLLATSLNTISLNLLIG